MYLDRDIKTPTPMSDDAMTDEGLLQPQPQPQPQLLPSPR